MYSIIRWDTTAIELFLSGAKMRTGLSLPMCSFYARVKERIKLFFTLMIQDLILKLAVVRVERPSWGLESIVVKNEFTELSYVLSIKTFSICG